jgi:hypothetical protein
MSVEEIIELISNLGLSVGLLLYFIYKDNKFTENITKAITSIDESLNIIQTILLKEDNKL